MMLNAAGGNLSIRYGLRGPNYAVATACASANNAIGDAFKAIQHGDADVMITGGTEAAITPMGLAGFQNMKALSTRNEDPARASRPFDADRDGFVLSEGAGLLVLEELEHAKARGAKIYGEVLGFGASADAGHITQPDEQGTGAGRAMSDALADAELESDRHRLHQRPRHQHAAGRQGRNAGDQARLRRARQEPSASSAPRASSAIRSAPAAASKLVVTIKALRDGVDPADDQPDESRSRLRSRLHAQRSRASGRFDVAMSNSFGFGGHNASVVVGHVRNGAAR